MPIAEKLPVPVQFWDIGDLLIKTIDEFPPVLKAAYVDGQFRKFPTFLEIRTLEGWMKGYKDWMLIQGVEGELYPCKKEIFNKTYKILDDECSTL